MCKCVDLVLLLATGFVSAELHDLKVSSATPARRDQNDDMAVRHDWGLYERTYVVVDVNLG
jgi:hypothetical protein